MKNSFERGLSIKNEYVETMQICQILVGSDPSDGRSSPICVSGAKPAKLTGLAKMCF